MSIFYVQQGSLQGQAAEIRKIKANDEQIIQRLRANINGLSSYWKGSAQEELVKRFQENQKKITAFLNTLEQYATVLDATVELADKSDKNLKSKVNSI